jgi:hypothetical protein
MDVHLKPELQAKVEQWAIETGRTADEIVEDVMSDYFDEIAQVREELDSRYDDIKNGKVQMVDGEDFFETLRLREEELLQQRKTG